MLLLPAEKIGLLLLVLPLLLQPHVVLELVLPLGLLEGTLFLVSSSSSCSSGDELLLAGPTGGDSRSATGTEDAAKKAVRSDGDVYRPAPMDLDPVVMLLFLSLLQCVG